MPNRILKESICTSETIDSLTAEEERFFYRLLVQCDDYGRMDGRPQVIRAKCFPLKVDEITNQQVTSWLQSLVRVDLIRMYEVDGRPYLQVTTWERHQQVRAKKSRYPQPPDGTCNHMISDDIKCPRNPNTNPNPNPNTNQESEYITPPISPPKGDAEPDSLTNDEAEHSSDDQCPDGHSIRDDQCSGKQARQAKKAPKIKYAEFVSLTEEEYSSLVARLGSEERVKRCIEILDNYKGAYGKKYRSDYRAILNWVITRLEEEEQRAIQRGQRQNIKRIPRAFASLMELEAELDAKERGNYP